MYSEISVPVSKGNHRWYKDSRTPPIHLQNIPKIIATTNVFSKISTMYMCSSKMSPEKLFFPRQNLHSFLHTF